MQDSQSQKRKQKTAHDELEAAASEKEIGIVAEFIDFLKYNKKWWITPILIVLLLFGLMIVLGGSPAAPFIYSLF